MATRDPDITNTNRELPLNPCHSSNTDMVPNLGDLAGRERALARPKELLERVLDVRPCLETWAKGWLSTDEQESGFADLRKSSKSLQKTGDDITFWYGVSGAWAGGRMSPSSRLSATSIGGPSRNGVRVLGEGDKITDGTLRWRSGRVVPGSRVVEGGSGVGGAGTGSDAGISTFGSLGA